MWPDMPLKDIFSKFLLQNWGDAPAGKVLVNEFGMQK